MADLLILHHTDNPRNFLGELANRILHDGLNRAGLTYRLEKIGATVDVSKYGAVLVWWFRISKLELHRKEALAYESSIEKQCREAGVPFLNGSRGVGSHAYCLKNWKKAGIPCGDFQVFDSFEKVTLPYPMILRVDGGVHSARDSFLVDSQEEARTVLMNRFESTRPNLNLAISFIDTIYPDGFYRKWRTIVVGDRLISDDVLVSSHWCVKMDACVGNTAAYEANRLFQEKGPSQPELLKKAAKALKQDILALDYSITSSGDFVFWEANRRSGVIDFTDPIVSRRYLELVGRTESQCLAVQQCLGDALAGFVGEKVRR